MSAPRRVMHDNTLKERNRATHQAAESSSFLQVNRGGTQNLTVALALHEHYGAQILTLPLRVQPRWRVKLQTVLSPSKTKDTVDITTVIPLTGY